MRTFTPPRMHVVRKEEKEARLKAFIHEQLARALVFPSAGRELTVLARSLESPVLKALAAHRSEIAAAGLRVRALLVLAEGACEDVVALVQAISARCGCDPRLLDAHEQLAIGDRAAWIGDCMRREPAKRDAYEIYSADCPETAALAHRSFDRVWAFTGAGPSDAVPDAARTAAAPAPVDLAIAALSEGEPAPVVSTRH